MGYIRRWIIINQPYMSVVAAIYFLNQHNCWFYVSSHLCFL